MPLYEYFCPTCKDTFEQLRPAQKADEATTCPACRQPASQRVLSLFASSVKAEGAGTAMPMSMPMAGGCCGGACGCHN